ncbi:MAG: 2-C-methyl-D-erythritol 4-phosphate cytidylyltransferase [Ruminococcus sp.]|nr:2-C-methyl-D-erythritol 4-phosphate cytidylyltransferase [Ruminococcus sp.]
MIFAGIVAGGSGTRMKSSAIPKQFIRVLDKPIIIYTIEKFVQQSHIDLIYIGIKPEWHTVMDSLLEEYSIDTQRVKVIDGGSDRNSTVMNIVNAIKSQFAVKKGDIILTHDAVRPFLTDRMIEENIIAALKYSACGTYVKCVDTIISAPDGEVVESTLDRSTLYRAQTPQSFDITLLDKYYRELDDEQRAGLTDTCSIFTANGEKIHIVEGDAINIKITTDSDLIIAKLLATRV